MGKVGLDERGGSKLPEGGRAEGGRAECVVGMNRVEFRLIGYLETKNRRSLRELRSHSKPSGHYLFIKIKNSPSNH